MAAGRLVNGNWMPAVDSDGYPIPDAFIRVFVNRTTTLATIYSDEAMTTPLPNPVYADSSGIFPPLWQEVGVLFSMEFSSDSLGPLGTIDDLEPSSNIGGAVNKLDRDGGNPEPTLLTNIGAADVTLSLVSTTDFSEKDFKTANAGSAIAVPRSGTERAVKSLTLDAADYGVKVNDFTPLVALANTNTINAMMAYLGGLGGGRIVLPRGSIYTLGTLDNKYSGVLVEGYMASRFHDAGSPAFGTTIVPLSAASVLKHRTPYASEVGVPAGTLAKNTGGGFINMRVVGNNTALRLLEVGSIASAQYDLYLENAVGDAAAYFMAGVTGVDLGEACDIQSCKIHLNVRQLDGPSAREAHCVVFAASPGGNANVSLNFDVRIFAQHFNGHALFMRAADNNTLSLIGTTPGGAGKTIQIGDPVNYDPNIGGNTFVCLSGNGGGYCMGTEIPGGIANVNTVVNYDNGNGSPPLQAGPGSHWLRLSDTFGVAGGMAYRQMTVADSDAGAIAGRNASTTATLTVVNGSNDHIRLLNGAQEWGLNTEPVSGDIRFVRHSGSGKLRVFADLAAASAEFSKVNLANSVDFLTSGTLEGRLYRSSAGELSISTNLNTPGSENYFQFRADGSFSILMGGLMVGGNPVVGVRGAAVADATDAASAITQLNALLARLRTHGLIAS